MINQYYCAPQLPATPFSFSILVTSPIRRDLQFSPVSAMILPLASIKLHFASMIIVGLDMLMSFLFKRDLVHPPNLSRTTSIYYPETLTLGQLKFMELTLADRTFLVSASSSNLYLPISSLDPVRVERY